MVKIALVLKHLTFFKVEEKLNQSENQLFQATIAMIFKGHIILPTFKTDLRLWFQFVSLSLQKWQKMR